MIDFSKTLQSFLKQANTSDLKTSLYPKVYNDLTVKVSFGQGSSARIPWIAFLTDGIQVSNGFYPVYLYYKEYNTLILSYGISETNEFSSTWPPEVIGLAPTIFDFFSHKVARYGSSYVYKAYNVEITNNEILLLDTHDGKKKNSDEINNDLLTILNKYKKVFDEGEHTETVENIGIGLFYMEKQLEDFLIQNWDNTEFGEKYELIIEEGEIVSQQYRTDVGPIDILAKDKVNGNYVVIELKKDQTNDNTIGQLTRYMGWVKEKLGDNNVKGIIISGGYNKQLDYSAKMVPNVEVYSYKIDFRVKKEN